MEENNTLNLSTFKPFIQNINSPDNIAEYFNNLREQTGNDLFTEQSNPFMDTYLKLKGTETESITPKIESPKKTLIDWLKENKDTLPIIDKKDIKTNSGENVDMSKGETGTAKKAINYLMSKEGLSKELAVAITANLKHESGFNTSAVGDTNLGKGQEAVGIGQWRLDRKSNMFEFLKNKGFTPTSFEGQLSFLVHELKGKESNALNKMLEIKDVGEMAKRFDKYYERSDGKSVNSRVTLAKQLYNQV